MERIPASKRPLISELLGRGMTARQVAENLGYSYGQVKGVIERYRLRKVPAKIGHPKFDADTKAKMVAMAKRMIQEGSTLPVVAQEIERITGTSVASNTIREWVPDSLRPRIRENAAQAKVMQARTRGARQRQERQALLEENQRLRDEVRRLRARLRRAEG